MDSGSPQSSWRTWLMSVMLTAIIALSGLAYQESQRATNELRDNYRVLQTQIQDNRERVIRMESIIQYQQVQLERIETGVNDLKRRAR